MGQKRKTKKKNHMAQELMMIVVVVLGLFACAAVFTDAVGIIGEWFRQLCGGIFGWGAYLFPFLLLGVGISLLVTKQTRPTYKHYLLLILLVLLCAMIEMLEFGANDLGFDLFLFWEHGTALSGGGLLGGILFFVLNALLGYVAAVVLVAAMIAIVMILTEVSLVDLLIQGKAWLAGNKKAGKKKGKAPMDADLLAGKREKFKKMLQEEPEEQEGSEEIADASVFEMLEEQTLHGRDRAVEPSPEEEVSEETDTEEFVPEEGYTPLEYLTPPITLLKENDQSQHDEAFVQELKDTAKKLIDTLKSFGVTAKVVNIHSGPSVTRYEVVMASGTKVSKIVGLAEDVALHLGVSGIRIAPVPAKSAVGIEVPNKTSSAVCIRECIESAEFISNPSKLAFALGKDITGKCMTADIAKMPHLLIAGATGSGKSVCINTIISSLLYKASPTEVKLLMIDPKVVELGIYNGIPHLVSPVVTDPKKAANALNWAVSEMTRRYKLFADSGVRDIKGYNEMAKGSETELPLEQIVIIIDELADLMMVAPNDVEDAICRLAQMARAAGMHLVIATQRPSVDVITGIIKANIPSRISFAVSSQIDSRTILDMGGAEKLLGRGDMLYYPLGSPKPVRVQGAFITDKEVEAVVGFVKENSSPANYNEEAIEYIKRVPDDKKKNDQDEDEDEWDVLLPKAIEIVLESQSASTSMLQRRMRVGYARAARLIDQLEEQGVVGPFEGSKPREVLMSRQQYLEMVASREAPAEEE